MIPRVAGIAELGGQQHQQRPEPLAARGHEVPDASASSSWSAWRPASSPRRAGRQHLRREGGVKSSTGTAVIRLRESPTTASAVDRGDSAPLEPSAIPWPALVRRSGALNRPGPELTDESWSPHDSPGSARVRARRPARRWRSRRAHRGAGEHARTTTSGRRAAGRRRTSARSPAGRRTRRSRWPARRRSPAASRRRRSAAWKTANLPVKPLVSGMPAKASRNRVNMPATSGERLPSPAQRDRCGRPRRRGRGPGVITANAPIVVKP